MSGKMLNPKKFFEWYDSQGFFTKMIFSFSPAFMGALLILFGESSSAVIGIVLVMCGYVLLVSNFFNQ